MDVGKDFILSCHKKNKFYNRAKCLIKTVVNNFTNFNFLVATMEHDYQEVSVTKADFNDLVNAGIDIGDGDLICKVCGHVSHDIVEGEDGHSYCQSKGCPHVVLPFSYTIKHFLEGNKK